MVLTTQTDPFHYNHTTSILHNTHIIMFHGFNNSNNSTYDNISAISWQSDMTIFQLYRGSLIWQYFSYIVAVWYDNISAISWQSDMTIFQLYRGSLIWQYFSYIVAVWYDNISAISWQSDMTIFQLYRGSLIWQYFSYIVAVWYDNISAISWQSDLLMKDTKVSTEKAIKLQEVTWPCVGVSEWVIVV